MKKFLLSLIILITSVFTVQADNPAPPASRLFVYPDVLEYAIKKHFTIMDWDKVSQEYENRMDANGNVSKDDIKAVCAAGRINDVKCNEFQKDLTTYFYDVCEKSVGKGKSDCVKDFWATVWGTWVRLPEAIGIAKEYALSKNKETIVCSPMSKNVFGTTDQASYLKCTSVDGSHYYTFKFNSTSESGDRNILNGTIRAIGKIHDAEFKNANCTLERIYSDSNCALSYKTSDATVCGKINKSLKRFGHEARIQKSEKFGIRCEVFLDVLHASGKNNHTAYGIDNTVFKDVQVVYGPEVEQRIRSYVYGELKKRNIQLKTFSCNASTGHMYSRSSLTGFVNSHDEYVTCYVNDQPIDFLFKDLSEGKGWVEKSGLSKMACAQLGGKIDGRDCRGLNELNCAKISHKIPGGTRWDSDAEACILNEADIEKKVNDRIQILGGLVFAVALPAATGAKVTWVLVSGAGSVVLDGAFIQLDRLYELQPKKRAYEFVQSALNCEIPAGKTQCNSKQVECSKTVVNQHFARLDEILDNLNNVQLESVADAMENVSGCLSNKELRGALLTSTPKVKDKLLNNASGILLLAGVFIQPEKGVMRITENAPKVARILSRCKMVERATAQVDGTKYLRIFVDKLDGPEDVKFLAAEFRNKGVYVSQKLYKAEDGTSFMAVAEKDIFSKLDDVARGENLDIHIDALKKKVSADFDRDISRILAKNGAINGVGYQKHRATEAEWAQLNEYVNKLGLEIVDSGPEFKSLQKINVDKIDTTEINALMQKIDSNFSTKYSQVEIGFKKSISFPKNRATDAEWAQLNEYLKKYGIELIDDGDGYKIMQKIGSKKTVSSTDDAAIFSKVYNDYLSDDVIQAKLKYVYENSSDRESAIQALKAVGVYDANKTTQLANDLADEAVRRIRTNPELIARMKRYRSLNNDERVKLIDDLHEIITTERRNHVGNTQIFYDFNTSWSNKAGKGTPDNGFVFTYGMQLNSIEDMLNIVFHENTHALQELGKTALPEQFAQWNLSNYLGSQNRLYYDNIVEIEAYAIGKQASRRVVQALGLY